MIEETNKEEYVDLGTHDLFTEINDANHANRDTLHPHNDKWYTTSRIVSFALHPFMIPMYAVILLLFGSTVMGGIPLQLKFYFMGLVGLNTIIVPAFSILMFYKFGYLRDLSLSTRGDRILPIIVIGICYAMCVFMIPNSIVSFLIKKFVWAALCCVIFALAVNFFWKISLHLIAIGGLTAMLLLMSISGFGSLLTAFTITIFLSGALASARLYLGSHNILQVCAGYAAGIIITSAVMLAI